ncbi:NitT/TauT family transport system substrate-binding protein [Desulfacinum hydrothermale DSM 13146]|uniref:NitT/TauT family transport system substrate-binding protein n=1 Tax=Desulfacinum hydrothermale DSM 13146 TaxID=1121390 RepID=A0A1W1XUI9_9BACT|nr:ABC transporter substrate-binding protein [Desulfacinum hydrothermale]SMC27566.1 NitT/TauT family transport system substrate-binding protein [Desulfacinum hydrothermale DSM 13146]
MRRSRRKSLGLGPRSTKSLWALLVATALVSAPLISTALASEPVRIGILPVLDTLPLQVAVQEGFFDEAKISVELVSFNSALERDAAMQGGQLQGYFGDLLNTLLLVRNGLPIRILTVSYASRPGRRMFALAGRPGLPAHSATEIPTGATVGLSNATIMEFLLDTLQKEAGIPLETWKRLEVKKIPLRLQMLLTGQLDLAVLPEPLVTLAESKGSKVYWTDGNLDLPLTVIGLRQDLLDADPGLAERFLTAYAKAVSALSDHPEKYRELMARTCRIPGSLQKSYPVPAFPEPGLPDPAGVERVQAWMLHHGLIQERIPYERLVWR